MIQGTGSGVGKTILAMALCRIFKQEGYKVASFKSQNITWNTVITEPGDEIAVSQLLQSCAAGAEPNANMNPIILKFSPERYDTQVILNGRHFDTVIAQALGKIRTNFMSEISKAYSALSSCYDIIVIEGAGTPISMVETNAKWDDIVNMGIAKHANAPVLLVSGVEGGGVHASLYGTINLLDEMERKYVKATIINRFKSDISYFTNGIAFLEKITGLPVAGVVPHIKFDIPDEDAPCNENTQYNPTYNYDSQFDEIADKVRQSLKMDLVYKILNDGHKDWTDTFYVPH